MRQRRVVLWIAIAVFLLLVLAPVVSAGLGLLVDWMWFDHLGFHEIFATILQTQFSLALACGVAFLLLTGVNLSIARNVARRSGYLRLSGKVDFPGAEKFPDVFRALLWTPPESSKPTRFSDSRSLSTCSDYLFSSLSIIWRWSSWWRP
jgi:hypothetical protein